MSSVRTTLDPNGLRDLQAQVWTQICTIAEGLAIAPALSAIEQRGMAGLLGHTNPPKLAWFGGNSGFIGVTLHALAQQGRWPGGIASAEISRCTMVPTLLKACQDILDHGSCEGVELSATEPNALLVAFIAAPALLRISDRAIPTFSAEPLMLSKHLAPELKCPAIMEAFIRLGWVEKTKDALWLTVAGRIASAFAGQFRYPLSYLPLLREMDDHLFGVPVPPDDDPDKGEAHLDRTADIRFSSEVFARNCVGPLAATALPLFRAKYSPQAVIDTGCGEATMLAVLAGMIRADPACSGRIPILIGVENSPEARAAAEQTLCGIGLPWHVVAGDITRPAGILADLRALGIDCDHALHLNKSVIHDRSLRCVGATDPDSFDINAGAFAHPNGSLADPRQVQADLVAFLRDWGACLGRFGMIAFEPHRLSVQDAIALRGRTQSPMMEALHGFSCQYLTSFDELTDAISAAGLKVAAHHRIGSELTGHDHMSCSHILPGSRIAELG